MFFWSISWIKPSNYVILSFWQILFSFRSCSDVTSRSSLYEFFLPIGETYRVPWKITEITLIGYMKNWSDSEKLFSHVWIECKVSFVRIHNITLIFSNISVELGSLDSSFLNELLIFNKISSCLVFFLRLNLQILFDDYWSLRNSHLFWWILCSDLVHSSFLLAYACCIGRQQLSNLDLFYLLFLAGHVFLSNVINFM